MVKRERRKEVSESKKKERRRMDCSKMGHVTLIAQSPTKQIQNSIENMEPSILSI